LDHIATLHAKESAEIVDGRMSDIRFSSGEMAGKKRSEAAFTGGAGKSKATEISPA
jgi:hypothetical protein